MLKSKIFWVALFIIIALVVIAIVIIRRRKKLQESLEAAVTSNSTVTAAKTTTIYNSPVSSWPLKLGSKGYEVTRLQAYLNYIGASKNVNLSVDGFFGAQTQEALQNVLNASSISQDFYKQRIQNFELRSK
jgi:peptidoglycan hydrolase-like protein with peptidoglycan-binding domain